MGIFLQADGQFNPMCMLSISENSWKQVIISIDGRVLNDLQITLHLCIYRLRIFFFSYVTLKTFLLYHSQISGFFYKVASSVRSVMLSI